MANQEIEFPAWQPPDWFDEKNYPDSEEAIKLGAKFWAWQFFRRNPDYQREYSELAANGSPSESYILEVANRFALRNQVTSVDSFDVNFAGLPNPARDKFDGNFDGVSYGLTFRAVGSQHEPSNRSEVPFFAEKEALVHIDLEQPIESQFRIAEEKLKNYLKRKEVQKLLNRPRKSFDLKVLPIWLRVLDASTDGVTDDDIAAILYPDDDNSYEVKERKISRRISDHRARAVTIRDREYRRLAHWRP